MLGCNAGQRVQSITMRCQLADRTVCRADDDAVLILPEPNLSAVRRQLLAELDVQIFNLA